MGDTVTTVSAFFDSGNTLMHDGVPVCFVTKKFRGFADYFAEQTLLGNTVQIEVVTVAGSKLVPAVLSVIEANGKKLKVFASLASDKCSTPYNLILSNAFCDETTATIV